MTFDTLLKALKDNPSALQHYNALITKMCDRGSVIVDTIKTGGLDYYTTETVFSNDCQIDVYLSDRKDGTREIAIVQYSNISDDFWTDCDSTWTIQIK